MDINLIVKGIVLGFSIAAPVGPIGILCIRRTLTDGRLHGIVSGLGAASADAFYGALAGFGFTLVTSFLVSQQSWLRLAGGLFLCYLGVGIFLSKPAVEAASARSGGLWQSYISTLFLTLSNPMTIFSFVAVFASVGLSGRGVPTSAILSFIGGVFAGSAAWWLILSGGVGLLRRRITPTMLQWVNRASGLAITVFGVAAMLGLI
jgi:threonine/homoserine/homoserine lactone efflux protein